MTPREVGVALAKRLAVAAVVVVVILAVSFAVPAATDGTTEREPVATPEYDPADLVTTAVPAEGDIDADGSVGNRAGVVVIDESHSNRFDRADLAPLVEELTRIGYGVRFYDGDQTLDQELSNVNAFVVVDPGDEFDRDEVEDVREFTNEGGHLLLVGEPTRKAVSASLFGTSITDRESALTTLAARYDMSLGTGYLYNTGTNGGNYKHVVAEPTDASELELDRVTMFTAAPVHARGGTVLLRAVRNTHESGSDGTARHPVAIHKERENVLLLGDSTFLRTDRYNVGDNEEFAAYVVEFLISGQRVAEDPGDEADDEADGDGPPDGDGDADAGDGGAPAGNNTTTPAPTTPTADLTTVPTGLAATAATGAVDTAGAWAPTLVVKPGESVAALG